MDLRAGGTLPFTVTVSCGAGDAGERGIVRLAAEVAGKPIGAGRVTVVCDPLPPAEPLAATRPVVPLPPPIPAPPPPHTVPGAE
ncbi:MAG: hypothetical protein M3273_03660, partial [Actinomycetota bacterium]|nr:hypothetical protein [Actinomycetota bacterium]